MTFYFTAYVDAYLYAKNLNDGSRPVWDDARRKWAV